MAENPTRCGIGLKARHLADILRQRPALDFLEIHAENYFSDGGSEKHALARVTQHYPLSIHGVGMSLGSDQPLDLDHLNRLKQLVDRTQPILVSEHLAWSVLDGVYLNDLLPIPYDADSLGVMADHIDQVQAHLGRQILIENPASYVAFSQSTQDEAEFIAALMARTGCGLLLDVNNLVVSHHNVGLALDGYLDKLPKDAVGEIHIAGHHLRQIGTAEIRIDNHGSPASPEVWQLYRQAVTRFGVQPSLVEWDSDLPPLEVLLAEAAIAADIQKAAIAANIQTGLETCDAPAA